MEFNCRPWQISTRHKHKPPRDLPGVQETCHKHKPLRVPGTRHKHKPLRVPGIRHKHKLLRDLPGVPVTRHKHKPLRVLGTRHKHKLLRDLPGVPGTRHKHKPLRDLPGVQRIRRRRNAIMVLWVDMAIRLKSNMPKPHILDHRGGVVAAKKELFRRKPPNHISLNSIREYWLDGLDVLYSPLFDALCHRCGQLLWGPVGAHKFLVSRDDSAVRTTNLFGVPPMDVITSAIFRFQEDLFGNYVQYKGPPFHVPPRLHPTSIGPFKVHDTPMWHSSHRMYACLVCSKYRAKYDPINYGYELDGTTHYNVPTKLANLTEYQKRQYALGALYSNTLKHVDLRHRQWHHAVGTVGVGRKPSQHYNALYGFMTMKEDVLRDYQKPKDSAQNTRQMNQALLLPKKIHPFYSRFLAHYATLYRYLQNAASTMGTLTQRFFEDKYGKRLEYHLQDEYVAWALECDAPRNIIPDFAPHQDKVGFMHRTPFQRAGGTVTAAAQSLANDTYLHFNDPKLEPCVWPDLYPGGVGGYKVGCEVGWRRITVAAILHLMSFGAETDGGPSSK